MSLVLEVQNLNKRFVLHHRSGARLNVLNDMNLTVDRGECVALHGQSGRGKSTLLRCLYGNYTADAGHILLHQNGRTIDMANANPRTILEMRRHLVGFVSQFLRVLPRVPALDIVAEPLVSRRNDLTAMSDEEHDAAWEQARDTAAQYLEKLRLPASLWQLPPATFSGGEQQRINIARGLITKPALLLLDEPTASLDGQNSQVVIELIQQAKQAGTAVVGIFHDQAVRESLADRCVEV